MTVREIAEKACDIVGLNINMSVSGDEQTFLVDCTKHVLLRLSSELTDIKKKKTITVENGIALYSDIDANYKRGIRLMKNGESVKFDETSEGLVTDKDGEYELTYAVYIKVTSAISTVNLQPKYGVMMLAEGVAGEYCHRKGMYKECEEYDRRFVTALENTEKQTKTYTVKAVEYDV